MIIFFSWINQRWIFKRSSVAKVTATGWQYHQLVAIFDLRRLPQDIGGGH
jgi:hypothetical protein